MYQEGTIGSDHYPLWCKINIELAWNTENVSEKWNLGKADWGKFQEESSNYLKQIKVEMNIETLNNKIKQDKILAAAESISKSKVTIKNKVVSWWDDKCKEVVKIGITHLG